MSNEWELKRVDEVATVVSGGTPSREVEEFWNGDINWATPTDITRDNRRTLKTTKEKITKKGVKGSSTKMLPVGTLLMTSRATLVEIKVAETEVCTNQGFKSLIPFECVDRWFLFYQMKNHKTEYERYGIGTTFLEVNKSDTDRFLLPFPKEKSTQTKIARILTTIDKVIEKTEATIAKYEAIKQGMMHDLFTRGIGTDGQLRPKYEDAPDLYKESTLGWIPKEWEVNEFQYYFKFISYGFTNPMPDLEDGPYMITAANVINGAIDYNTARKTSQERFDTILTDKSRPKVGDLLLTKDGTLGRLAIVDKNNICINQSVAIIRFNEEENPIFFKFLLESPTYQKRMLDDAGGSTIKHIYITVVDKMLLVVPRVNEERENISKKILKITQLIQTEKQNLSKQTQLKQGLMQDLLTGKVPVKADLVNA